MGLKVGLDFPPQIFPLMAFKCWHPRRVPAHVCVCVGCRSCLPARRAPQLPDISANSVSSPVSAAFLKKTTPTDCSRKSLFGFMRHLFLTGCVETALLALRGRSPARQCRTRTLGIGEGQGDTGKPLLQGLQLLPAGKKEMLELMELASAPQMKWGRGEAQGCLWCTELCASRH